MKSTSLRSRSKRSLKSLQSHQYSDISRSEKSPSALEKAGVLSQIFLAGVAIFGYFYTVRPVYQKEQLAEQVAEYDSIIRKQTPKIKEIEGQLTALREERAKLSTELQRDRTRMGTELKQMQNDLLAARDAKQKIEGQIEFMAYRYRTADGTPAVTREQVRDAQLIELRRNLLSSISTSCTLFYGGGAFGRYSAGQRDPKNSAWPFSIAELDLWKEYREKYPLKRATECVESAISRFIQNPSLASFTTEINGIRRESVDYAEKSFSSQVWSPSIEPTEVIQELSTALKDAHREKLEELKTLEEKYKGWEKSTGDRYVLLKHNYETERKNADITALGKTWEAEAQARKKYETLSKAIEGEVKRLVIGGSKSQ